MRRDNDYPHVVVKEVDLPGNAELHRFVNGGGVKCSAIYVNGEEMLWHYSIDEERLLAYWNLYWKTYV